MKRTEQQRKFAEAVPDLVKLFEGKGFEVRVANVKSMGNDTITLKLFDVGFVLGIGCASQSEG